jgi:hypothetical protein
VTWLRGVVQPGRLTALAYRGRARRSCGTHTLANVRSAKGSNGSNGSNGATRRRARRACSCPRGPAALATTAREWISWARRCVQRPAGLVARVVGGFGRLSSRSEVDPVVGRNVEFRKNADEKSPGSPGDASAIRQRNPCLNRFHGVPPRHAVVRPLILTLSVIVRQSATTVASLGRRAGNTPHRRWVIPHAVLDGV